MIDVAEKVICRIADQVVARRITVRQVFQDKIIIQEIDSQNQEILTREGLFEALRGIDIDDLTDKEKKNLLLVVGKPELGNIIMLDELSQIFENLGLNEAQLQINIDNSQITADNKASPKADANHLNTNSH